MKSVMPGSRFQNKVNVVSYSAQDAFNGCAGLVVKKLKAKCTTNKIPTTNLSKDFYQQQFLMR